MKDSFQFRCSYVFGTTIPEIPRNACPYCLTLIDPYFRFDRDRVTLVSLYKTYHFGGNHWHPMTHPLVDLIVDDERI